MDMIIDVIYRLRDACLQLLTQPFYYIGIGFVVLLYRRKLALERKLFLTKLHSFHRQTWLTLLWGIVAGFVVSCAMALLGATIHFETLILLWVITLLLMLFRARFFCFSYAIGIIGIGHVIASYFAWETTSIHSWLGNILEWLQQLHLPTLLALVAITHMLEAMLIHWSTAKTANPMIVPGKRGRLIGGYQLDGFWILPIFLVIPSQSSNHLIGGGLGEQLTASQSTANAFSAFLHEYFPLLGELIFSQHGWSLLAFPFAIGISVWTTSMYAKQKARWTSSLLLMYSAIMLAFALAVAYFNWPILALLAAVMSILLHEGIAWYSAWSEQQQRPLYTHEKEGMLVLGVIAGSPAETLGIVPGEIVRKVNGMVVNDRETLHEAFSSSPAYCKLEVVNLSGESKFMQRPLFAGEHHQLGLIFAPDSSSRHAITRKNPSLLNYITLRDLK